MLEEDGEAAVAMTSKYNTAAARSVVMKSGKRWGTVQARLHYFDLNFNNISSTSSRPTIFQVKSFSTKHRWQSWQYSRHV